MDWQPIETAPLDGTEIDVWAEDESGNARRICDVSWSRMTDWDGHEFEGWTGVYPHFGSKKFTPTHWMFSPKPPGVGEAMRDALMAELNGQIQ